MLNISECIYIVVYSHFNVPKLKRAKGGLIQGWVTTMASLGSIVQIRKIEMKWDENYDQTMGCHLVGIPWAF